MRVPGWRLRLKLRLKFICIIPLPYSTFSLLVKQGIVKRSTKYISLKFGHESRCLVVVEHLGLDRSRVTDKKRKKDFGDINFGSVGMVISIFSLVLFVAWVFGTGCWNYIGPLAYRTIGTVPDSDLDLGFGFCVPGPGFVVRVSPV